jgi:putative transposase
MSGAGWHPVRFRELGSPWQNGVNENFNGRFRVECLDRDLIGSVLEAPVIARAFREVYNTERRQSSIGYQVPVD